MDTPEAINRRFAPIAPLRVRQLVGPYSAGPRQLRRHPTAYALSLEYDGAVIWLWLPRDLLAFLAIVGDRQIRQQVLRVRAPGQR